MTYCHLCQKLINGLATFTLVKDKLNFCFCSNKCFREYINKID